MPIVYKDGRKFEKWRKSAGSGTVESPHVPYTRLDGPLPDTATGDLAAIREVVADASDLVTGQLLMTGSAVPLSGTSRAVNMLVLSPMWGDIYLGGSDVTDETGVLVTEAMVLKNKDLADLYAVGVLGSTLTWAAW